MRESGHKHWSSYCNKHPYEWNNYKTLAILRNPVQRFLSCYNYARMDYSYWHSIDLSQSSIYGKHPDYDICKKHEINELIYLWTEGELLLSHPGWGTQQAWILDNALVSVKYIAFFDKLDEAMNRLVPSVKLEKLNASPPAAHNYIHPGNIKRLNHFYRADFELQNSVKERSDGVLWESKK